MHRSDKIGVSDGKPGRRADDRVNAAIGAERGPALVLNPLFYITDCIRFFAKEAAADITSLQLRSMVGRMAVCGVESGA